MKVHPLLLTPISPLHIGCGDEYEPVECLVDEGRGCLQVVDHRLLVLSNAHRVQLADLMWRTDGNADRDRAGFLRQRVAECPEAVTHEVPVTAGALGMVLNAGSSPSTKNFLRRTAFGCVGGGCLVPGSSVKGAIRTAVLARLAADPRHSQLMANTKRQMQQMTAEARDRFEQNRGGRQRAPRQEAAASDNLTGKLLELSALAEVKMPSDPFRLVHLADASAAWQRQICIQDFRYRPDGGEKANLASILEVVRWQQHVAAEMLLTLPVNPRVALKRAELGQNDGVPSLTLSAADLAAHCSAYYCDALRRELAIAAVQRRVDQRWQDMARELLVVLPNLGDKAFLLRVGRHSGADCVTIAGVRSIKILRDGGRAFPDYEESPHGLWLCAHSLRQQEGMLPFGWVLVETKGPVPELRDILVRYTPAPIRVTPVAPTQMADRRPTLAQTPAPATLVRTGTPDFGAQPSTDYGRKAYALMDDLARFAATAAGRKASPKHGQGLIDKTKNVLAPLLRMSTEERAYVARILNHFAPIVFDEPTLKALKIPAVD